MFDPYGTYYIPEMSTHRSLCTHNRPNNQNNMVQTGSKYLSGVAMITIVHLGVQLTF